MIARGATALWCAGAVLAGVTASAPALAGCGGQGIASTYSAHHVGKPTASGEKLQADGMTAAHPRLPFGTTVRVVHQKTGRSVTVRINDRGPFIRGRIIDLSPLAARELGFSGLAPVTVECRS